MARSATMSGPKMWLAFALVGLLYVTMAQENENPESLVPDSPENPELEKAAGTEENQVENKAPLQRSVFEKFDPNHGYVFAKATIGKKDPRYKEKCRIFAAEDVWSGDVKFGEGQYLSAEKHRASCFYDEVHKIYEKFWSVRFGQASNIPPSGKITVRATNEAKYAPVDIEASYDAQSWMDQVDAKNSRAEKEGGQVDHQVDGWFKATDSLPIAMHLTYQAIREMFEVPGEGMTTSTQVVKKGLYISEIRVFYEDPVKVRSLEEKTKAKEELRNAEEEDINAAAKKKIAAAIAADLAKKKLLEEEHKKKLEEIQVEVEQQKQIALLKQNHNPAEKFKVEAGVKLIPPPLLDYARVPRQVVPTQRTTREAYREVVAQLKREEVYHQGQVALKNAEEMKAIQELVAKPDEEVTKAEEIAEGKEGAEGKEAEEKEGAEGGEDKKDEKDEEPVPQPEPES